MAFAHPSGRRPTRVRDSRLWGRNGLVCLLRPPWPRRAGHGLVEPHGRDVLEPAAAACRQMARSARLAGRLRSLATSGRSVADNHVRVARGAIAARIPCAHAKQVAAVRVPPRIPGSAWEEVEPEGAAAIRPGLCENAALGGQVLLRPRRVVVDGPRGQHRIGPEHLLTEHHATGRNMDEYECEPVDMVRGGQVRQLAEPALKRLPVGDPHTHIDTTGETTLVEPLTGCSEYRDVRRPPPPARPRGACRSGSRGRAARVGLRRGEASPPRRSGLMFSRRPSGRNRNSLRCTCQVVSQAQPIICPAKTRCPVRTVASTWP
jgi:hypothetical protein